MADATFTVRLHDFASRGLDKIKRKVLELAGAVITADGMMDRALARSQFGRWFQVIGALAPVAASGVVTLTAAIAGLGSVLMSVAPGLGILGAAIGGNFATIKETELQLKKLQGAVASATTADAKKKAEAALNLFEKNAFAGGFGKEFFAYENLKSTTKELGRMKIVVQLLTSAFTLMSTAMDKMKPAIKVFGGITKFFLDQITAWVNGPGFTKFLHWVDTVGALNFTHLLNTTGHLIGALFNLSKAFSGIGLSITGWLDKITGKFEAWTGKLKNNKDFKSFIADVKKLTPDLLAILGDLGKILWNLARGIAHISPGIIHALRLALDKLAQMDPNTLAKFFLAFEAVNFGSTILRAILSVRKFKDELIGVKKAAIGAAGADAALKTELGTTIIPGKGGKTPVVVPTKKPSFSWLGNILGVGKKAGLVLAGVAAGTYGLVKAWQYASQKSPAFTKSQQDMWNNIKGTWSHVDSWWNDHVSKPLRKPIIGAGKPIADALSNISSKMTDWLNKNFGGGVGGSPFAKKIHDGIVQPLTDAANKGGHNFKTWWMAGDSFDKKIGSALKSAGEHVKNFWNTNDTFDTKIKAAFSSVGQKIASVAKDSTSNINKFVANAHTGMQNFVTSTNRTLDGLKDQEIIVSAKAMKFGAPDAVTHSGTKKARGGPIHGPGSGTSDSVPAWLSNGEYVINAKATRKNYPLLEAINSGIGYAKGGLVSPSLTGLKQSYNWLKDWGHGLEKQAHQMALVMGKQLQKSLQAAMASRLAGFSGGGSSGANVALGKRMASAVGWTGANWTDLYKLWSHESGWSTTADNPNSSAYGIPQALPGSKMASAGADWRTNPATQIRWGLGYIRSVYGNPINAWGHELGYNWYDKGGILNHGGVGLNQSGHPEAVLTDKQWHDISHLAATGGLNERRLAREIGKAVAKALHRAEIVLRDADRQGRRAYLQIGREL